MTSPTTAESDLVHLRRCVELAREALAAGDEPFGSMLVSGKGEVLFEDRNRTTTDSDATLHPEFELARWAGRLDAEARAAATAYTSGEHCAMCSAAHGYAGLGRLVYAVSDAQRREWLAEWGVDAGPVRPLPVQDVVPGLDWSGPAPELEEEVRELHRRRWQDPR